MTDLFNGKNDGVYYKVPTKEYYKTEKQLKEDLSYLIIQIKNYMKILREIYNYRPVAGEVALERIEARYGMG